MRISEVFLDYLKGMTESRLMFRSPSAFLPFVIYAALLCLVLFAMAFFLVPPMSAFMVPVIELLGGDRALHYPMHLVMLPDMYHLIYLPLTALVGFALFGWAVFRMGDTFQQEGSPMDARRPYASAIPAMLVIGVVYVAAATAPAMGAAWLGAGMQSPQVVMLLTLSGLVVSVALQSLLVYAPMFVRTESRGAFAALGRSIRFAGRRMVQTAMILLTAVLAHQPIDYLLRQPDKVALKFRPELIIYLLVAGIVVELFTTYLLFSATTGMALSRREDNF